MPSMEASHVGSQPVTAVYCGEPAWFLGRMSSAFGERPEVEPGMERRENILYCHARGSVWRTRENGPQARKRTRDPSRAPYIGNSRAP